MSISQCLSLPYITFLNINLTTWMMLILYFENFNFWGHHELLGSGRVGSGKCSWSMCVTQAGRTCSMQPANDTSSREVNIGLIGSCELKQTEQSADYQAAAVQESNIAKLVGPLTDIGQRRRCTKLGHSTEWWAKIARFCLPGSHPICLDRMLSPYITGQRFLSFSWTKNVKQIQQHVSSYGYALRIPAVL